LPARKQWRAREQIFLPSCSSEKMGSEKVVFDLSQSVDQYVGLVRRR
jgi:hypothetical protein